MELNAYLNFDGRCEEAFKLLLRSVTEAMFRLVLRDLS